MSTIKKIIFVSIFLLFSGVSVKSTQAATINTQSNQTTLGSDEELSVNGTLNINTDDGTTYYLRGVFYKSGTTDYCGYTWNEESWFKGPYTVEEGWKNFLAIQVNSDSWSGILKAKLDTDNSSCSDSGEYGFKIQRFTAGGSKPEGGFDTQNELVLSVVIPTLTPTPTPSPTPEPTDVPEPTATPTPHPPTATPTPKPTATPTRVPTLSPTPTEEIGGEVLGEIGSLTTSPTPTSSEPKTEAKSKSALILSVLAAVIGGSFIGFAFLLWRKRQGVSDSIES